MPQPASLFDPPGLAELITYLHRLGYFMRGGKLIPVQEIIAAIGNAARSELMINAVRRWQAFHSRRATGVLSAADIQFMHQPRCQRPDIEEATDGAGLRRWGIVELEVGYRMTLAGLTVSQIKSAWERALGEWEKHCGLNFTITSDGTVHISATSGVIDGRNGTLAYSYLPGVDQKSGTLDQVYDSSEAWSEDYLMRVIMHEVGHAIGFSHSSAQADLMYPSIISSRLLAGLGAGEIQGSQARYGPPRTPTPTDPTAPPKTAITRVTVEFSDGRSTVITGSSPGGGGGGSGGGIGENPFL